MKRPLTAGSVHSPAWTRLLLTGTLLASCICSASSELPSSVPLDFLHEGASPRLAVRSKLDGILSTSWFREHEAQPEAMVSPEGLPGPDHTGREMLGAQGSLVARNVTAQDSGSYTVVLENSRRRRSVTEHKHVKANIRVVWVTAYPMATQGIIQSELNYSVVLQCLAPISPTPVLYWIFNGKPRGTGEKLIIRRLSREDLGTYMCVAKSSQNQESSNSVAISLPETNVDSTDEFMEPDPSLIVSGGSAIALLLVGSMGLVILVGGICFSVTQAQRTDRRRIRTCC